jgi:hypothetical protein
MEFKAVTSGMGSFSATNKDAAATISGAGSADSAAMLSSAAAALGPIGANYLASYAPAQANNLAATKLLAYLHAAIGGATDASVKAIVSNEGEGIAPGGCVIDSGPRKLPDAAGSPWTPA